VARRARALGLPVAQPRAIRGGPFPERLRGLAPDLMVVVAYGRILPRELLEVPRHGCVNVHASLLPRWRGAAPIQAAVLAGDAETGVCTQRMVEGMDEGPVYVSRGTPIGPRETAGELHDRLAALGAEVLAETLAGLPGLQPRPQEGEPTYVGKIDRESGRIDWTDDAAAVDRRIRAMTPWPGGWVAWADGPLKVVEAVPVAGEGPPGTVLTLDPLVVACGRGAVALVRVQAPGRRVVAGGELARSARLRVGGSLLPEG
jgi:methionyl-tRNA formyltransferase